MRRLLQVTAARASCPSAVNAQLVMRIIDDACIARVAHVNDACSSS